MGSKYLSTEEGFSLIEILLVVSLFIVVLTISSTNLFNPLGVEKVNNLSTDITSLLKDAQAKAMASETSGQGTTSEFGIHFTSSSYTLFKGSIFNPADTNNFTANVASGLSIAPNLPCPSSPNDCSNIVFSRLSGEVLNFNQTQNSLCLADNLGNKILLTTNYLGVVNAQINGC